MSIASRSPSRTRHSRATTINVLRPLLRRDASTPARRSRYRPDPIVSGGSAFTLAPARPVLLERHGSDGRADPPVVVTAGDHRTVCSQQPAAADRRPPARGAAPPRRTNLAPPATPISLCCFSFGCGVAPDDDVRPRDRRQRCANRTTRGCRRAREKSLRAASLRILAEEPDLDPARVPEATRAPIGGHRRRDGNRLDGVGDQPSPRR